MRTLVVLGLLALLVAPPPARAKPRTGACCLEVPAIPGVTMEPRCLVVNLTVRRRHPSPRLLCRIAGGDPVRHGTCTCPHLPLGGNGS